MYVSLCIGVRMNYLWSDWVIILPFTVTNGVCQGGILSPIFCNIYLNDLSNILNDSSSGCMIISCRLNHLFYADDSVELGPSPMSRQEPTDLGSEYACSHELSFNIRKTKYL